MYLQLTRLFAFFLYIDSKKYLTALHAYKSYNHAGCTKKKCLTNALQNALHARNHDKEYQKMTQTTHARPPILPLEIYQTVAASAETDLHR